MPLPLSTDGTWKYDEISLPWLSNNKLTLTEEWIKKLWCTHTMEYYSAIKKNEIMPFAATWMDLEINILSEVSHKQKDKYHMIPLICGM